MHRKIVFLILLILSLNMLNVYAIDNSTDGKIGYKDDIVWDRKLNLAADTLYSITYGNGTYIAVGEAGLIKFSKDGSDWTTLVSGTDSNLYSVAWGGERFVAVGDNGTIVTSKDGLKWEKRYSKKYIRLRCVTWGNEEFIVGGDNGTVMVSKDAGIWKEYSLKTDSRINGIAWNSKAYIAVGSFGAVFSSADGAKWNEELSNVTRELYDVAWNGQVFVAVGANKKESIAISADGKKWTSINTGSSHIFRSIVWDGKRFLSVGESNIFESAGGLKWTEINPDTKPQGLYDIVYNGIDYITVGEDGTLGISKDGTAWTMNSVQQEKDYTAVVWNGRQYIAFPFIGDGFLKSPDGNMWIDVNTGSVHVFFDILWDGKKYIAVGQSGGVYTSEDGGSWTRQGTDAKWDLRGISYNGKVYVTVGDDGMILISTDGIKWSTVHKEPGTEYRSITWGNGMFVIGGSNGTMLTSTDGRVWTQRHTEENYYPNTVVWNGKQFITGGNYGKMLISSDGLKWESIIAGGVNIVTSIAWNGNKYVAVGEMGLVMVSFDGRNWFKGERPTGNHLSSILWDGKRYIVVGSDGTIMIGRDRNSDTRPSSEKYLIDYEKKDIWGIPAGTSINELMSGIRLPEGARYELDLRDIWPIIFDDKLLEGMILRIVAEEDSTAEYRLHVEKNSDAALKSTVYTVNEKDMTISGVAENTHVKNFMKNTRVPVNSTVKILQGAASISESNGYISKDTKISIIAEDGLISKVYTIKTQPVIIKANGKAIKLIDAPAVINNKIFVSAESFAKAVGASCIYDKARKQATITKGNINIVFNNGSPNAVMNRRNMSIGEVPVTINNKIFIPAGFALEIFGYQYKYECISSTEKFE
ncbi:MAG TPA: stalk domain-containing protein [Clostridia bacterium]|nr:stalk domain-containing protein [Clostridia bacterium]